MRLCMPIKWLTQPQLLLAPTVPFLDGLDPCMQVVGCTQPKRRGLNPTSIAPPGQLLHADEDSHPWQSVLTLLLAGNIFLIQVFMCIKTQGPESLTHFPPQWTIYIVVQTAPILNAGARAGTPPACWWGAAKRSRLQTQLFNSNYLRLLGYLGSICHSACQAKYISFWEILCPRTLQECYEMTDVVKKLLSGQNENMDIGQCWQENVQNPQSFIALLVRHSWHSEIVRGLQNCFDIVRWLQKCCTALDRPGAT